MSDRGRQLAHRRDAVGVRELQLRLAICFFGALAVRHVDLYGDNLDQFSACGEHWLAD